LGGAFCHFLTSPPPPSKKRGLQDVTIFTYVDEVDFTNLGTYDTYGRIN
jgi:GH18 family chitinase